jgi:hypothetical protein
MPPQLLFELLSQPPKRHPPPPPPAQPEPESEPEPSEPEERRRAQDGQFYTQNEFLKYYRDSGVAWRAAANHENYYNDEYADGADGAGDYYY